MIPFIGALIGPIIDAVGGALGLPKEITTAAKAGIAAVTGDVVTALSCAADLVGSVVDMACKAATTECPRKRSADGYAPAPPQRSSSDDKYANAVRAVHDHFDLLDTAAGIGWRDGVIGKADLEAALRNPDLPAELKEACRYLLANPAALNKIDAASVDGPFGLVDGFISKKDVKKSYSELPPQAPGASAPGGNGSAIAGAGSAGGSGTDFRALLASGMSLEDVVMFILGRCLERLDKEVENTIGELDAANQRLVSAQKQTNGNGGSQQAAATAAKTDVDKIQMRMQSLVEKRQQMFQLMSTMSSKFNESSKAILANLSRA